MGDWKYWNDTNGGMGKRHSWDWYGIAVIRENRIWYSRDVRQINISINDFIG